MKPITLFLFSLGFLLAACRTEQGPDRVVTYRFHDKSDGNLTASSLMEFDGIVPLQSAEKSLLQSVDKIELFGNCYYILDKRQAAVFVFDDAGRFIRRIGARGQGPEEYPAIADFTVDKEGARVMILSDHRPRVYAYDLHGVFLQFWELEVPPLCNIASDSIGFAVSANRGMDVSSQETYLLYRFDKAFRPLSCHVRLTESRFHAPALFDSSFQELRGGIGYVDYCSDTIYFLTQSVFSAFHVIYPHPMPFASFRGMAFREKQQDYDWLKDCLILNDRIIFASVLDGKYHIAVADLEGNILKSGKYAPFILPKMFRGRGDEILSPVSVESYLKIWREFFPDSVDLSPEGNDVILKWRLKL